MNKVRNRFFYQRLAPWVMAGLWLMVCSMSCEPADVRVLSRRKAVPSRQDVTVKVYRASGARMDRSVVYVGTVEQEKSAPILCPATGTVKRVYVHEGDRVSGGQLLVSVESQSVRSAFDACKSTYEQAQDGMRRLRQVYDAGSVAEVKMVEMQTNLAKAEAAYKVAAKALDDCQLRAPFDGTVHDVLAHPGMTMGVAAVMMTVVDASASAVHFSVPESDWNKVKVGDSVRVDIPSLAVDTVGVVASQSDGASVLSHCFDYRLGPLPIDGTLMPGMVCKVHVDRPDREGIVIPATAFKTDMDGRYVWTVTDGIVGKQYVSVCGYSGDGILVDKGIEEGMLVVVEGARKISTGMSVKTTE